MTHPAQSPTLAPVYITLAEAMARLAYVSANTFRDHINRGWIRGAVKRGSGAGRPGGRWVFRAADLAYEGPAFEPALTIAAERAAAATAQAELEAVLADYTPMFSRSRNRSQAAA